MSYDSPLYGSDSGYSSDSEPFISPVLRHNGPLSNPPSPCAQFFLRCLVSCLTCFSGSPDRPSHVSQRPLPHSPHASYSFRRFFCLGGSSVPHPHGFPHGPTNHY